MTDEALRAENDKLRGDVERMFNANVKKNVEIARLLDENTELEKRLAQYELFREVVGDPAVEFANLRRELHRVERENEKLRELVREYAEIANYICEVYNGCGQEYDHCKYDPLNNDMCKLGKLNGRARELGVEVDG